MRRIQAERERSHKSFRPPDLNKEPLSAFLSQTLRGSLSPRRWDELMNEASREARPWRPGRSFQATASGGVTECSPSGAAHSLSGRVGKALRQKDGWGSCEAGWGGWEGEGREEEPPLSLFSGGVTVAAACLRLRDGRWEKLRNRGVDVRMWKSADVCGSSLKVKRVP